MTTTLLARVARGALLALGVLTIAIAVLTVAARLALPFAERWTDDIERGLSDYLGRPVSIASLSLRWRGTGPELRAQGVEIAETARRRISVDEALIDLDLVSSLARRSPVFDELTLVGADLVLERDARRRWSVRAVGGAADAADAVPGGGAGRDAAGARAAGGGFGWLFDARRVGLLDTRLALADAASGPIVAIESLDVRVENDGEAHRLRLEASLPPELGGDVELGMDLVSGMRDAVARRATGRFHVRADRLESAALLGIVAALAPAGALPAIPVDAHVALELWGTLDGGALERARGRLEAEDVRIAGRPDEAAVLDVVATAFRFFRRDEAGTAGGDAAEAAPGDAPLWTLVADGARASRGDERARIDTLRASRSAATGTLLLEAAGEALPVGLVAALPLALIDAGATGAKASAPGPLRPRGTITRWSTTFRPGRGLRGLDLSAEATGLAGPAVGTLPGIDALDASISMVRGRGVARVSAAGTGGGVVVDAPRIDADPLAIDALEAELAIDLRPAGTASVSVAGPVALEIGGLTLSSRVALAFEPGLSPRLDLSGRFGLEDLAELPALLPDRLLSAEVVDWSEMALRGGRARGGELLLSGRLADFPWTEGTGVLRAGVDVADVELDWLPGWPVVRGLTGSIRMDGTSIEGEASAGSAAALELGRASWRIADLRRAGLALEMSGRGALSAMLDFATDGPLAELLEPALGDVSGTGEADVDLVVSVPLSAAAFREDGPLALDGTVFLSGNALGFGRARVDLADAVGAIGFDEAGFRTHRLRGDWLGRPIVVDAVTDGAGPTRAARVTVSGALAAKDVLAHYELPLDGFADGASVWRATLVAPFDGAALARGGVTLRATSDLVGTALTLPAPLGKSSALARPVTLGATFFPDAEDVRWSVRSAEVLEAHADVGDAGLTALALGLGGTPASVAGVPGVRLDGRVEALSLDGWAEALGALIDALPATRGDPAPILPVSGTLDAGELTLFDAPLGPARLRLNTDDAYLNAALDNERLRGSARWPRREGGALPALLRFARVDDAVVDALLGPDEPAAGAALPDTPSAAVPFVPPGGPDPRELPPIRARIASLGWRGATLANLTLRTEPDVAGLRIDALGFTHEDLQLIGEGYWRVADPQGTGVGPQGLQRTALSLTLQSGDFGAGLAAIGLPDLMVGGAGRATARIGWPGPAWGPSLGELGGALRFELEDGSIVPLDPGAGKLIGLLAFQALPRRLDLDFSDLTDAGLAFSTLTGRAGIEDGVVDAALVRLAGPVGVIDVQGATDLVTQTLDQRVTVLPRVSAALPVIGVIAGGASAGVGALLAGGLLKALGVDLDRIGLREYALGGTWDEPTFEPWRPAAAEAP